MLSAPSISVCKRRFAFWRLGAFTFLALLTIPAAVLLALVYHDINTNLRDIKSAAAITNQHHLPSILSSQRTLINIESLRRYIETVYSAADPMIRREALYNALALATESVFESDTQFATLSAPAKALIRSLAAAKDRSFNADEALLYGEVLLADAMARLAVRAGLTNTPPATSRIQHLGALRNQEQLERLHKDGLAYMTPFTALCNPATSAAKISTEMANDCEKFQQSWATVESAWQAQAQAEQDARYAWKQLDDLLRELSDQTSSTEAEQTYLAMDHINQEAEKAQITFYLSCTLISFILITASLLLHRHMISPLLLASRYLRSIYSSTPASTLPTVRIRELQELLNMLPLLRSYIDELAARSGYLEQEKDRFENLSLLDGLTGVGNRRSLDIRFASVDSEASLAVLMIDVDLFKLFNDTHGHQAGDSALISIARAIRKALLRATDDVFRYGGEEFCVILPSTDEESAMMVAARVLAQVRELAIPHEESCIMPILTVSIGVALRPPLSLLSNDEILMHADKALYAAKNAGRNRISLFRE